MSTPALFAHTPKLLQELALQTLEEARLAGATAAEVDLSEGFGQHVTVRLGEVETIEHTRDKDISVTVYFGHRKGSASTSDFSRSALRDTVLAAANIARYTGEDLCSGLADAHELAQAPFKDLDLYHPWDINVERAIETARTMEAAAMAVDPRLTNSDGATVSTSASQFVYANSTGFLGGYPGTQHSLSCAVLAEENGAMQRDYWYSSHRDWRDLDSAEAIGRMAGDRTARRLNARQIPSGRAQVIFEAPVAASLIRHFIGAVSGGSLYRKSSFLLDSVGQEVFAPLIHITEDPFIAKAAASGPFDGEGVAVKARDVVKDGVVQGYFLGSYSARKLGLKTTGNAGGAHNLVVKNGQKTLTELLAEMGTGLLVTELMGQGVNGVTGDYSRGAAGFWVENGVIAYPVEEITIAGNLKDMFKGIQAVGSDVLTRGSISCGSIWLNEIAIAGE